MPSPADIEEKFWKAVKSDRTMMVGLADAEDGLAQPMTAQLDAGRETGPLYFFTAKDTDLARALTGGDAAQIYFAAKGHELFASVDGVLTKDDDRELIDRLWNPFVAAWFEGGKDDPKLQLLRFDLHEAQVWLNDHSLFAGIKLLLGIDPKAAYDDKTATIRRG
jgi:general stress protein 26